MCIRDSSKACFSVPPLKHLAKKTPFLFKFSIEKSRAISKRCVVLIWSVCLWPVVFAAISDKTTSGFFPSNSIKWSPTALSLISPIIDLHPAISSVFKISTPTTFSFPVIEETFSDAICSQPPGAHPKSITETPGSKKLSLSFICNSLKAALDL